MPIPPFSGEFMVSMLRRKVGTKIILGYLIAVSLMVGIGVSATISLNRINATVDHLTTELAVNERLSKSIVNQILLARYYANRYVRTQSQADLDAFDAEFSRLEVLLNQAGQPGNAQQAARLNRIKTAVAAYNETFREIGGLIKKIQQAQSDVLEVQGLAVENKLVAMRIFVNVLNDPTLFLAFGNTQNAFQKMRLNVARYISENDERQAVLAGTRYRETLTNLEILESTLENPAQRHNVAQTKTALEAYFQGFQAIRADLIKLNELLSTQLNTLEPEISRAAQEIAASVEQEFAQEHALSQTLVARSQLVLWATTLVSILVSVGLGLFITRRIVAPLQQVMQTSRQIAEVDLQALTTQIGRLSQGDIKRNVQITTQPLKVDLQDEVGQTAQAFNKIIFRLTETGQAFGRMAAYLDEMAHAASAVAQGNLNVPVPARSRDDVLGNALINMVSNLQTAQTGLKASEKKYRTLFEDSQDAIFMTTPAGQILDMNPAGMRLFGYTSAEMMALQAANLYLDPTDSLKFRAEMARHGAVTNFETQFVTKDGVSIDGAVTATAERDDAGNILNFRGILRDVTQQKRAAYLLAEYNRVLEQEVTDRTRELSQTLHHLKATQAQLVESEKMVALGQLVAGVAHEINTPLGAIRSSVENIADFLKQSLLRLPTFFEQLPANRRQDFLNLVHRSNASSMALLSSQDKRKRKRQLRRQLEEDQIINADTVADILVDIGVEEIEPYLPVLKSAQGPDILNVAYQFLAVQKSAQTIITAADQAAKVVFALRTYARYDTTGEKVEAKICDSLETVLTLYHNRLKRGVSVTRKYNDVPPMYCYPDELNQIWTNLIHNAVQAMEGKGKLDIEIKRVQKPPKQANSASAEPVPWIAVGITDNGPGIPPAVRPKIFEPFFTTKPAGEGSGLGLDIVQKIVDRHQGDIEVFSEPGKTTFTIFLPVNPVEPQQK
jgi:PAS domain S-box-containing protein